jgi:acetyl-CoA carboxylase biotin carboxyl carrier protein
LTPEEMKQLATLLKSMPGIKSIELKDVKRLADLLREAPEIGSIEVQGFFGTKVVITRTALAPVAPPPAQVFHAPAPAHHAPGHHPPAQHAAPHAAAESAAPTVALKEIKSPMVGTYYRAPEPGADAYVQLGSRVTSGQTVCIIEAMKIMNEIEAEVSGVIREVCVEDATPVEYGQVLYRVDPNG